MGITVGLTVAALICIALVATGIWVLGRGVATTRAPVRRTYQLVAMGLGAAACGVVGTALLVTRDARPAVAASLVPLAIGQPLGAVLQLGGLLRQPEAPDLPGGDPGRPGDMRRPGAVLRQVLDGTLLAACAVYIPWTLVLQPALQRYEHHPAPAVHDPRTILLGAPTLVSVMVVGIAAVALARVRPPRTGPVLAGSGLVASTMTGLALLVTLWYGGGGPVAAFGIAYAISLLFTANAVRHADQGGAVLVDVPTGGNVLALVPVTAAILAALVRMLVIGGTDNLSIVIAAGIGLLITIRQMLANSAARRYARRLAEREAFFKDMAFTDALTGLGNRRQLMRVLEEQAIGGPPCVLMAIDLDGFKAVNDIRGHDVGDAVLVEVGRRLRANLRPGDVAARVGGDEFAVLMWGGPDEAFRVAERLLTVLNAGYEMDGSAVFLSASIGLADGTTGDNVAALVHNADLSLRFAKQRGKSRVERYDAAYDQWMRRRNSVEQELRGAIDRDELSLVYQPVIELPDGRPVGVEALVRWYHPRLGQVSPAEFIPIAEESGLVTRVDRWVLHHACHQLSRWIADGHDAWVSVNISIRELHLPEYVSQVVEVLQAHRVPPERLVLEVTEHAVALDLDEVVDRLAELREVGVRVALDDFGAGYSSLGQLRRLPVDILKIDRVLVDEPPPGSTRPAGPLVGVVVELGRQLGLAVIAEGVADQAQQDTVAAAGCRLIQGDLFARPMPAEHVEALLAAAAASPGSGGAEATVPPKPRRAQDAGQFDSAREMRQS